MSPASVDTKPAAGTPEAPDAPEPPRPSRWQVIRAAPATVVLFAICVGVFIAAERAGSTQSPATLVQFGAVQRQLVWAGQPWRLATSMFLHIGFMHLFWNGWFGFKLCAAAERQLGSWRFLALYLGSGIVGSAVSVMGHDAVSAGASGALFGVVGFRLMALRLQFGSWRAFARHPGIRRELIWIAAWFAIGVFAHFDNYAHGGGLLFGGLFTWALAAGPDPRKRRRRLAVALGIGALLVAGSLRPLPFVHASATPPPSATVVQPDPPAV